MNTNAINIEIFLPNGNPKGIKKACITRDKIEVIECSKKDFLENKDLLNFLGIYILVDSPESNNPEVYIGKGKIQDRLNNHKDKKDFWNSLFAINLKTNNGFNDSQLSFMEHYFINKAKDVNRCNAEDNKNIPKKPNLDNSILCDIYHYINVSETLLSTLGLKIFQPYTNITNNSNSTKHEEDTTFFINITKNGIKAQGVYTEEGFILLKGSQVTVHETSAYKKAINERKLMLKEGVLTKNTKGNSYILTKNYKCSSPSLAGAIVTGRASNGCGQNGKIKMVNL